MKTTLSGVMPALLTPFTSDEKIDEASLRKLVLNKMGIIENPICRRPFAPVKEEFVQELHNIAEQLKAECSQLCQ